MMTATKPSAQRMTLHASAVLVGAGAVLIRGPSSAGKSRLVLGLIAAAESGRLPFARLVADDRTQIAVAHGRLLASAPAPLAGLLEIRGLGVRRLEFESCAVVTLVVDLGAEDGDRLPAATSRVTEIAGIRLPRLPVAPGQDPFPLVLAALTTSGAIS
jgi:serine kinase of HPr protein (carbohydrate metabolism regulator)